VEVWSQKEWEKANAPSENPEELRRESIEAAYEQLTGNELNARHDEREATAKESGA
jgi:hypothetical protein